MELDVVVAWDAGQKDFMGFGINRDNHVDVASCDGGDVAVSVDTANINVEGVFGDVDVGGFAIFDFGLNGDGI